MTMKARTYYIIFRRPPIGGKLPPPLAAPLWGAYHRGRIQDGFKGGEANSEEWGREWMDETGVDK